MTLPWYRWFPTDFAGDARVRLMSTHARAAYRDLLDLSWEIGPLKAPQEALKSLGWSAKCWVEISPCWRFDRKRKGWVQPRLEAERKNAEKRSQKGRDAAAKRWES